MLTLSTERSVSPAQFRDLLVRSSLAERRPIDEPETLQGMIENSNLIATCWDEASLVGIARSVTDFHYCCYLSDLAVDRAYQRRGIGRQLVALTQSRLSVGCSIILLAAPGAQDYYPHLGFEAHPRAWVLPRGRRLSA